MPDYGTFSRFIDYSPPVQETQVIRMPDGSLVMTGSRTQQQPGMLERLKAAASQFIPSGLKPSGPEVPWWIAQPAAVASTAPVAAAPTSKVDPWSAIAAETAHEEGLKNELGKFSTAVMSSPQLIEGRWFK